MTDIRITDGLPEIMDEVSGTVLSPLIDAVVRPLADIMVDWLVAGEACSLVGVAVS